MNSMEDNGITNQHKGTILSVLAHPDDESFGMGGTLALYAKRGVDVHLVCAPRGEVGEVSPEILEGFDSVSALRVNELRCAAGILGLKGCTSWTTAIRACLAQKITTTRSLWQLHPWTRWLPK